VTYDVKETLPLGPTLLQRVGREDGVVSIDYDILECYLPAYSGCGMSISEFSLPILPHVIEVDRRAGEIRKEGLKISLPEQLFRLLVLLMDHPGEVVTREEIRNKLWSDSFVNFDDSINSAIKRLRQCLQDSADHPRFIETLPGHGYRFAVPADHINSVSNSLASSPDVMEPRVAVLPFESLSGDPADEHLVDSLTDALITALAKVSPLHVKPRSSVMIYKDARKALSATGRRLKVDAVVQGSVVHCGRSVRVSAQLLSVATEEHLWAESYDHEFHDLLTFQTDVAGAIAAQVTEKLLPAHRNALTSAHARRPAAYEAYLKAHYVFKNFTDEGLWKARHYWKKAVHEDPSYAKAYAGLAESYNMLGITGVLPAAEALAHSREAAKKALEIDDSLSEAHASLGFTHMLEWDWAGAGREFKRAIQLDPNLSTGNPCHYVEYLMAVGRTEEAIAEVERAQEIQPLSLFLGVVLGWVHYANHSFDRAIRQHQKVVAIEPNFAFGHWCLGMDYAQKRKYKLAIEECRTARLLGATRNVLSALGYAYAMAGDKDRAHQVLKELKGLLRATYAPPYAFATIHAGLGEKDEAFDWLGRAYQLHDPGLIWMKWDPQLDQLRSDSRFQDLLNSIGLQVSELSDIATA
jgi:TolB-like protein/Tfp pilus assembly protein PilF